MVPFPIPVAYNTMSNRAGLAGTQAEASVFTAASGPLGTSAVTDTLVARTSFGLPALQAGSKLHAFCQTMTPCDPAKGVPGTAWRRACKHTQRNNAASSWHAGPYSMTVRGMPDLSCIQPCVLALCSAAQVPSQPPLCSAAGQRQHSRVHHGALWRRHATDRPGPRRWRGGDSCWRVQ